MKASVPVGSSQHADLMLGRRAPDEIFPLVETFLSAHATRV
jgi:hypothetical protein